MYEDRESSFLVVVLPIIIMWLLIIGSIIGLVIYRYRQDNIVYTLIYTNEAGETYITEGTHLRRLNNEYRIIDKNGNYVSFPQERTICKENSLAD